MGKKVFELFFDEIDRILEKIKKAQKENILKAAELVSECIKNDGVVYTFGTGHSHLIAEEIFARASTLFPVRAILEPSLTGHHEVTKSFKVERLEGFGKIIVEHVRPKIQDIFIVISNSGVNAVPVEFAIEAKKRGNKVIAITSKHYSENVASRHSSGKKLMDVADIVLDNCGRFGDYAIKVPNLEQGLGPTSGITGAYIIHSIMVQAAANLVGVMKEPPVAWSGNLPDGDKKNQKLIEKYWNLIRNW
ncbi:MAG: SIS domain-containing protein [Elusimicrobiota bacterium]|nr:SIS domain-containing protein [Elusimicrobiota bacterium]